MYISRISDYDIDESLIAQLKYDAITAAYRAQSARKLYTDALKSFWMQRYKRRLGRSFTRTSPLACVIHTKQGPVRANLLYFKVWFDDEVRLIYQRRIKSGKWGKTEHSVDPSWVLDNINCS